MPRVTSTFQEFYDERDKIDEIINAGFEINTVEENLSGAFVEFTKEGEAPRQLHIINADARKHFSTMVFIQQQKNKK